MNTKKLTGCKRHRVLTRMFRKPVLVLQVEENTTGTHEYYSNYPDGYEEIPYDKTYWRDANVEDYIDD